MDRQRHSTLWRGIVRDAIGRLLLIRTAPGDHEPWRLIGGSDSPGSDPATAFRRECVALVGIEMHHPRPLPPVEYGFGTHRVTYRLYLGRAETCELLPLQCAAATWVEPARLAEFSIESATLHILESVDIPPAPGLAPPAG